MCINTSTEHRAGSHRAAKTRTLTPGTELCPRLHHPRKEPPGSELDSGRPRSASAGLSQGLRKYAALKSNPNPHLQNPSHQGRQGLHFLFPKCQHLHLRQDTVPATLAPLSTLRRLRTKAPVWGLPEPRDLGQQCPLRGSWKPREAQRGPCRTQVPRPGGVGLGLTKARPPSTAAC